MWDSIGGIYHGYREREYFWKERFERSAHHNVCCITMSPFIFTIKIFDWSQIKTVSLKNFTLLRLNKMLCYKNMLFVLIISWYGISCYCFRTCRYVSFFQYQKLNCSSLCKIDKLAQDHKSINFGWVTLISLTATWIDPENTNFLCSDVVKYYSSSQFLTIVFSKTHFCKYNDNLVVT